MMSPRRKQFLVRAATCMLLSSCWCPAILAQGLSVSITRIATAGDTLQFSDGERKVANFPYPVLTGVVSVADDRFGDPVTGLADTARWLSGDDLRSNWPTLRESIAGARGSTINPDLYSQMRGPWIREVTRLQSRPTSTMLVVDLSTSIKADTLKNVRTGLTRFVSGMRDNIDRAGLMGFRANQVEIFGTHTFSKQTLASWIADSVKHVRDQKRGTPLYRALRDAVNLTSVESPSRLRSIIVYTDGGDNEKGEIINGDTVKVSILEVVKEAETLAIPIYTIWLGNVKNKTDSTAQDSLRFIAEATNGRFVQTRDGAEFEDIYKNLSQSLQHYYAMAHFAPEACGDPSVRTIEIEARDPDSGKSGTGTAQYTVSLPLRQSDVSLTRPAATVRATFGDTLHQTFRVVNGGPSTAIFIDVRDSFPEAFLSYVPNSSSVPPDSTAAGELYWSFDSLASGASVEIKYDLVARRDSTRSEAVTVADVATLVTVCDPDSSNNRRRVEISIGPKTESDLHLSLSARPDSVEQGEFFEFELVVENLGTAGAGAFTVTQSVSSLARLTDFAFRRPPERTEGETLTWSFDTLAVGQSDTIGFSARVPACPEMPEPALNIATRATVELQDGSTADPVEAEVVILRGQCSSVNLSLRQTANPAQVRQGEPFSFFLEVSNRSGFDAGAFTVFDVLPAEVSVVATNFNPSGGLAADTLRWDFSDLRSDTSLTIEITVEVACQRELTGFPLELLNAAWLEITEDADLTDNQSSAGVTVTESCPDFGIEYELRLAKRVLPDTVYFGQPFRYQLTVTNEGPDATGEFRVWDLPPADLTLSGFSPEPLSLVGDTLNWRFDGLTAGDSISISYEAIWSGAAQDASARTLSNLAAVVAERDIEVSNNTQIVDVALRVLTGCQDGLLLDRNVFQPGQGQPLEIRTKAQATSSSIAIYDITGYRVRKLAGGAAQSIFQWDGSTDDGQQAGSGVYLILFRGKLLDGATVECDQRVILVR